MAKIQILMQNLIEKIKLYRDQVFLIAAIMLIGLISFGLGRLSAKYQTVELNIKSTLVNTAELNKIITDDSVKNKTAVKKEATLAPAEGSDPVLAATPPPAQKIVGNKQSKIYHYDDCPGALKMRAENKIYFVSVLEAKNAGFRPAGNCPGLK